MPANSLVVRAVHRNRTGVGSIPAGGPIVDEFFSTVPGWNFDMCMIYNIPSILIYKRGCHTDIACLHFQEHKIFCLTH